MPKRKAAAKEQEPAQEGEGIDSDGSHDEVEERRIHCKPLWARFWAVFVCITLGVTAASDQALWAQAAETFSAQRAALEAQYESLPRCGDPSRVRCFMERWLDKWQEGNFTCADKRRSGRKRLLSVKEAEKAAALIKKGKWIKVKNRNKTYHRLVYYTSIRDAIDNCPELADICTLNGITAEQLREAMHYADPDLVRKRITFKRRLSKEEKADRVRTAEAMLQRLSDDPSLLERMVFIDETSVVLLGDNHDHVHAWCDKNDVNFHDVCPLPAVTSKNPLKVHIIAAVSAHPAFAATNGLVYVEVTTGTSYIKRRTNKRLDGSTRVPDYNYQKKGTAVDAKSTTEEEFKDNLYQIVKEFHKKTQQYNKDNHLDDQHTDPILCYDNNKIQRVADIKELEYDDEPVIQLDPNSQRVHMPTYSPDMNRPIEHVFGFAKPKIRSHIYELADQLKVDKNSAEQLQGAVFRVFEKELVPGAVRKDVMGLPLLWHVVSTPWGEEYTDSDGDVHLGCEGDYPPAYYR